MSEVTGDYNQVDSFSFHPQEPCVPVFGLVAEDDSGNMTIDALDESFELSPGWNYLAMDLSEMGDGNEYRIEWYYEDSNSWNGWYYDDLYVNTSDPDSYMLHFDLWMDDMDCDAHLYARVTNTTDGQWNDIGNYDVYIPGPCMLPIQLEVPGDEQEISTGSTELSLIVDYLDEGSNYTLEYYYSMNSGFYGWYSQDIVFSGAEQVDFTVDVTEWDCSVHIYASIYNTTGGNYSWVYSQSYHLDNPSCYQSWMELTDESGDYVSYSDIDPGTTDLIWRVSFEEDNIPEGHEFELTWYHIVDWDWDTRVDGSLAWTQSSDSEVHIPWNVSVTDFDCNVYAYAQLMTNTSDGFIVVSSYGMYL